MLNISRIDNLFTAEMKNHAMIWLLVRGQASKPCAQESRLNGMHLAFKHFLLDKTVSEHPHLRSGQVHGYGMPVIFRTRNFQSEFPFLSCAKNSLK